MAVRHEDSADLAEVVLQVRKVGNDGVDAGHVLVRERDSAVDDNDVVVAFESGNVLADFAESSERDDSEFLGSFLKYRHINLLLEHPILKNPKIGIVI